MTAQASSLVNMSQALRDIAGFPHFSMWVIKAMILFSSLQEKFIDHLPGINAVNTIQLLSTQR